MWASLDTEFSLAPSSNITAMPLNPCRNALASRDFPASDSARAHPPKQTKYFWFLPRFRTMRDTVVHFLSLCCRSQQTSSHRLCSTWRTQSTLAVPQIPLMLEQAVGKAREARMLAMSACDASTQHTRSPASVALANALKSSS